MKKRLFIISAVLALLFLPAMGLAGHADAFDPFRVNNDPTVCSHTDVNGNGSPVCSADGTTNPITGNDGLITKAANIFAVITGFAAIVVIIVGGFEYVRSSGDSTKTNKAKNTILFALIGLVIVVLARAIVALVIDRL